MKITHSKKLASTLLVSLAGASLLAACGGGSGSDSGNNDARLLVSASSTKITIPSGNVTASSSDTTNVPNNANDNDLLTHWTGGAASGTQWIQFNLGGCYKVDYTKIGWYNGDTRKYDYTIKASGDNGATWTTVTTGVSDGITAGRTVYDFPDTSANVMRVESTGNNTSTKVSINEIEFWSPSAGTCGTGTTTSTTTGTTATTAATTTTTAGSTTTTLNTSRPPGENFDLSAYTLQTFDSSMNAVTVDPIGSYTDKYFFTDTTGGIKFWVPSGAGSTANSDYPRSELRNKNEWSLSSSGGTHTLTATVKVVTQPSTKEIIVGQIHGDKVGGSEALKIRWSNGAIVAGYKTNFGATEVKSTLISGIALNSAFTYSIKVVGLKATVTATHGSTTATKTITYSSSSWSGIHMYFKAGNYSQDDASDGSKSSVVFTALN